MAEGGSQAEPVLRVEGLRVDLAGPGGRVLDGVSLSVRAGECLAVVGESGAGKSVLARSLLGLTQTDPAWRVSADRFELAGRDARRLSRRAWRGLRGGTVSLVLQDALQSLDPLRTIEAEVGEALAIRGVRGRARRSAVIAALEAAGLPDAAARLGQRSGELSGGMRQRALIASALVTSPRLLVADEPTAALDPTTAARVLRLFAEVRDRGAAVVLITHELASAARVADRIAVLDGGRIAEAGPIGQVFTAPRHPRTRALIAAMPRGPKPRAEVGTGAGSQAAGAAAAGSQAPGPVLLALRGAARRYGAPGGGTAGLHGVELELRRGEAVGVVGASGAGKSTLARLLVGAERPDEGAVERADPPPRVRLIPQDPLASFDPRWRVERILAASIPRSRRSSRSSGAGAPPFAPVPAPTPAELLAQVGLGDELLRRRPASLSGGQRQRIAIARALAAAPQLLVCDEPVSALDMSTQAGILALLREVQRSRGLTLVFISHDLAAVRSVCERLVVLHDGRVVETGETERVLANPREAITRELIASSPGVAGYPGIEIGYAAPEASR
ncbi:ATP-binding cassette domain-containing protein [Leucobacter massiliensis]|uniref:ABC transporter ATP-binding protein n=1 Tax=Leucobacter massiliensis TaxID=1686285 RepID=A0A2S9QL29_9MICO|nr:ABC transporter ATP-binding protein [Leucobacter massiliensis]PRI10295.1 ABC transporter ATP-binding protein [Leucobacter massiliensis]